MYGSRYPIKSMAHNSRNSMDFRLFMFDFFPNLNERVNRRLSHARKSMLTRGQKSRQKCRVDNLLGFSTGKCIKGSKISDFVKYTHLHGESSFHLSPSPLSHFVIILPTPDTLPQVSYFLYAPFFLPYRKFPRVRD